MTVVFGTAGHIDHGKTALLRALTGIDADRLPEERRRGMTIDVGYAWLRLPDGSEIDFVDVPGHDRLVGNMLVGAGEIDAVLLVVAADDGPRAQTVEHLGLLDALGIATGVVAITKVDLLDDDPERLAQCEQAVSVLLSHTSLDGSPILRVSSTTGAGVADLATELARLSSLAAARLEHRATMRLAIDRFFTVRGHGLVVTGTARGEPVRGMSLRLEPGGGEGRVRELQVHGHAVDRLAGGGRVACNLALAGHVDVRRGAVLTDDPAVAGTERLLVAVRLADRAGRPGRPTPRLRSGTRLSLHLGTDQVEAVVRRGRRTTGRTSSGEEFLTLRLDRPVAAAPGDRFVLRRPGPESTVGGGRILDTRPPAGPSGRRVTPEAVVALAEAQTASDRAAALVALHGGLPVRRVRDLTGCGDGLEAPSASMVGGWYLSPAVAADLRAEAVAAVTSAHGAHPESPGMSVSELRPVVTALLRRQVTVDRVQGVAIASDLIESLVRGGELARDADRVRDPARAAGFPARTVAAMDRLESLLSVAAPPPLAEAVKASGCPPEGVRALESAGRLVVVDRDLAWSGTEYARLEGLAVNLATGGPLSPAAFRDATGTSRKYALAMLEDLGRRGILRRTDAGHIPGPRVPRP